MLRGRQLEKLEAPQRPQPQKILPYLAQHLKPMYLESPTSKKFQVFAPYLIAPLLPTLRTLHRLHRELHHRNLRWSLRVRLVWKVHQHHRRWSHFGRETKHERELV